MPIAPEGRAHKGARVDHRFNRIAPAFPARWVTAYCALSSVTGLFATVAWRIDDASQTRSGRMHLRKTWRQHRGARTTRLRRTRPSAPKVLPGLVPPGEFWRRRLAASFVRAPADRSRKHPPCDPVARPTLSRPSHPTTRSWRLAIRPFPGGTRGAMPLICPTC